MCGDTCTAVLSPLSQEGSHGSTTQEALLYDGVLAIEAARAVTPDPLVQTAVVIACLVCAGDHPSARGDFKPLSVPFQFHLCAAFFQESPVPSSPFGAMITLKSSKQVIKPNSKHFRTTVGNKVHRSEVGGGHQEGQALG